MDEDNSSTVPSSNEPPVRRPLQQPEPSSEPDMQPRFQPATPVEKPKKQRSKAKVILTALLVLALAGAGALGYMWYTAAQSVDSLNKDKELLSKENTTLKEQMAMEASQRETEAAAPETTADLQEVYSELMKKDGRQATEDEVTKITTTLADELEYPAVPEGAFVVGIYRDGKENQIADKAIVFWPASENVDAKFLEVVKESGFDEWKYLDAM